mmetsp:Transcript_13276/g.35583  ORF Transcript_13276/g.35583 Transcript_13276/m.35583 type:complete len:212 (+) Transcript_13276:395-1030(+)
MPGTSRPLLATSVAKRTRTVASLKACMVTSLSCWLLSPWIESQRPRILPQRLRSRSRQARFVDTNTSVRAFGRPFRKDTRASGFSVASWTNMTSWAMSRFAQRASMLPTRISTGSRKKSSANFWTRMGQVAEKTMVCRSRDFIWPMRSRICGSKPSSNMRSASSSTRNRTCLIEHKASAVSRRSDKRPGVATTRCGRARSPANCGALGTPP